MSTASNIETIPPEILLHIFSLVADTCNPQYDPSANVWRWSMELRAKKSLVQVCKTWRGLALGTLYHRIYILRLRKLLALVELLEAWAGYRDLIHEIHGNVGYYYRVGKEGYVETMAKLLKLCSSCEEFSWKPLQGLHDETARSRFSTINILCNMRKVPSSFLTLRVLSITLDYTPVSEARFPASSTVTFPNLEELVCEASTRYISPYLDTITHLFILPNLRLLSIAPSKYGIGVGIKNAEDGASICNLLERHGGKLTAFTLDLSPFAHHIQKTLQDLLKLTPNLVSIKFCQSAFSSSDIVFASPCVSLRKIELYNFSYLDLKLQLEGRGGPHWHSMGGYLSMMMNRANFPCLQSIVILDFGYPEIPFGFSRDLSPELAESSFQYFLPWADRCRKLDIALLRVDLAPLISPEQEQQNAWKAPVRRPQVDAVNTGVLEELPSDDSGSTDSGTSSDAELYADWQSIQVILTKVLRISANLALISGDRNQDET